MMLLGTSCSLFWLIVVSLDHGASAFSTITPTTTNDNNESSEYPIVNTPKIFNIGAILSDKLHIAEFVKVTIGFQRQSF